MAVVGKVFALAKACPTHATTIGMHAVVISYTKNAAKADRFEAELDFYSAEDGAVAAAVGAAMRQLDAAIAPLSTEERAALIAARERAVVRKAGLPHASLSKIHGDWRTVFSFTQPARPDDAARAETARRALLESVADASATLSYTSESGVIRRTLVTGLAVEEVDWSAVVALARVTFAVTEGSHLVAYEEIVEVTTLETALAEGDGAAAAAAAATAESERAVEEAARERAAKLPRVAALESRAAPGEFDIFLNLVVPWIVSPDRVAAYAAYPHKLVAPELERWLKGFGACAEPVALSGPVNSTAADELLEVCARAQREGVGIATTASPAANTSSVLQQAAMGAMSPFLFSPPDLTGSETAQRERTALRGDAQLLLADAEACGRLAAMARAIASEPAHVFAAVLEELKTGSEPLSRLILSGDEVRKSVIGVVPAETELQLESVRSCLDRRLERAVLTSTEAEQALPAMRSALRWVRLGRLGRVRLLHLLDMTDDGTDTDPLAGFGVLATDGMSEFSMAMMRLALAWALAWPPHASLAYQFITRLTMYIFKKRAMGVQWSAISMYYRALLSRVDSGAKRYASREERFVPRTAPVLEWIDGQFDHVRALSESTLECMVEVARTEMLATFASSAASLAASTAADGDLDTAKALAKAAKKRLKGQQKRKQKQQKKSGNPPPAGTPSPSGRAPPAGSGAIVPFNPATAAAAKAAESRASIAQRVAAAHPPIQGRKACTFFFGPAKSCTYDAAACPNGHHGE